MNNTLDFNRLGKVIRRDGMNYIPNFGWSLVILWAIPLVIWLLGFVVEQYGGEITGRGAMLKFLSAIALIIAPAKLYKDCNDSRKGIQYAMMPASTLEKFLSMFLYCVIVTPIVYMVGAVALDTIMAAFPGKNPYEGFIFKSLFDPMDNNRNLTEAIGGDMKLYDDMAKSFFTTTTIVMSKILGTISTASIFMFGNMIFKKRKTSKMIGILILIFIIVMIFFIRWAVNLESVSYDVTNRGLDINIAKTVVYLIWTFNAIVSIIMLGLTYYKIKTQKY